MGRWARRDVGVGSFALVMFVFSCVPAPARAQASAYGVVAHDLDARYARKVVELGTGFARVSVRWWQVEPSPGVFDWSALDEYVWRQAAPAGIQLFMTIGEPPEWAGGGPDHNRAPAELGRWRNFVRAVVARYRGYVRHWGVWNEPDSPLFLDSRDAYRAIALEARAGIKDADPSGLVLGPEVSESALDDGWFAELMTSWGHETFDIVTVHIYSTRLAEKMDQLVLPWRAGKEVWLTEVGRTASPGNIISEELQRLYYRSALDTFERRRWWWSKIFFYDLVNWDGGQRYGIVTPSDSNLRAFGAYRDWIRAAAAAGPTSDADRDGLPDAWEGPLGLDPASSSGANGAAGDADGDGVANLDEYRQGTHPRGVVTRYLSEGASSTFFDTSIAVLNLDREHPAHLLVRWLDADARVSSKAVYVPPGARATIQPRDTLGSVSVAFATVVESDVPIVVDRTMTWGRDEGGAHAETAVQGPSTAWYFAEGATHSGFSLFYLLQNPSTGPARAEITFLRPTPLLPVHRVYDLAPLSRTSVWVNQEDVRLAATDVSATVTSDRPIIVERAMYLAPPGHALVAGHESAGVTTPQTRWFLAEGATGPFFDEFVLIANPTEHDTRVMATYLLPDGTTLRREYAVAARSRYTVWVDQEDPALADTAVSTIVESLDGTPIVVERTMWWPGSVTTWYETHNTTGAPESGTSWGLAEGEEGGARGWETFVLIANTGDRAGRAEVRLHLETGAVVSRVIDLPPTSRTNVMVASLFPEVAGRRYGVVVESVGADPQPLVVERAAYANDGGAFWRRGTNLRATRLR